MRGHKVVGWRGLFGHALKRRWPIPVLGVISMVLLLAFAAPALAPVGDFIAVTGGGDIGYTTPDGGVVANVTNTPSDTESSPNWDVSQQRLVYVRGEEPGPTDVFMYDFGTASETQVTFNGKSRHPSVRGNLVAYVREVTMSAGGIDFPVDQIYTKNLVTKVYRKLTDFKPGQDMAGPPHLGHTTFTPLGEGISFMWGRRWDSRFVRVVGKYGGTVFNVPTDFMGDTRFSWSPAYVTLYYASRDIGGVFKAHTIHRRHWPSNADPATETTVLTGNDTSWNMSPSAGHSGLSVAYEWTNGAAWPPGALNVVDWTGGNDHAVIAPVGEPAWYNGPQTHLGTPAVKNLGPQSGSFNPPGQKAKLRFRTGSKQTVLMNASCYVYNSAGHLVRIIGPYKKLVGYGYTWWNGKNVTGHFVAPGVYHYRFRVEDVPGWAKWSSFKNVVVLP